MSQGKHFVLVCGSPRSGTTELVRFLNLHKDFWLGCERFIHRYSSQAATGVELISLFSRERQLKLLPGDTFWTSLSDMPGWLDNGDALPGRDKAGLTPFFGDKAPDAIWTAEEIITSFAPFSTAVVCVRDVLGVSRSWVARSSNLGDALWDRRAGIEEAICYWAGCLSKIIELRNRGVNVIDVFMPRFYRADRYELNRLLSGLGVNLDATQELLFNSSIDWALDNPSERRDVISLPTDEEKKFHRKSSIYSYHIKPSSR